MISDISRSGEDRFTSMYVLFIQNIPKTAWKHGLKATSRL